MDKARVCKNEKDVKREVKLILDLIGAFYFMPPANAFGRAGISDIIGLHNGKFFAIETKFGHNKPTPLQLKFGELVTTHGGLFIVINEANLGEAWEVAKW